MVRSKKNCHFLLDQFSLSRSRDGDAHVWETVSIIMYPSYFHGNYSRIARQRHDDAVYIRTCPIRRSPRACTYVETTATAQQLCRKFLSWQQRGCKPALGSKLASAIARLYNCLHSDSALCAIPRFLADNYPYHCHPGALACFFNSFPREMRRKKLTSDEYPLSRKLPPEVADSSSLESIFLQRK